MAGLNAKYVSSAALAPVATAAPPLELLEPVVTATPAAAD